MRNHLTPALVAVAAAALTLGLAGCTSDPTDKDATDLQAPQTSTPSTSSTQLGSLADCSEGVNRNDPQDIEWAYDAAEYGEKIVVTNSSHFPLQFAGVDSETQAKGHFLVPPVDLKPHQSETIWYCSNNAGGGIVNMSYKVAVGTEDRVSGFFQVPPVLKNQWSCGPDTPNVVASSAVKACSEDKKTNHAEFRWEIRTNTSTASFPDLSAQDSWTFHPYNMGGVTLRLDSAYKGEDGDPVIFGAGASLASTATSLWNWVPKGDGWGWLRNNVNGKCLEQNASSGVVDTWTCEEGADNELWRTTNEGRFLQLKSSNGWLGGAAGDLTGKPPVMNKQGENLTALAAY